VAKKFLAILVISLLCILSFTASADTQSDVKSFTLKEAIDYALSNNSTIALAQKQIDAARVQWEEMSSQASSIKEDMVDTLDLAKAKYFYPEQMKSFYDQAVRAKDYTIASIKYSVEDIYYKVLEAKGYVDVMNQSYEIAKKNYEIVDKRVKLGMATKNDLLTAEYQLSDTEAKLRSAQNAYEIAVMNFNKIMGLPLTTKINLTSSFTYEPLGDINLDDKINNALKNRFDLFQAKEDQRIKQLEFDITKRYYTENTYVYQKALYNLEQSNIKVKDAEQNVELSVRTAYLNLKNAEANYTAMSKNLDRAKENLRLTQLRYDAGLASVIELMNAQNLLMQAENQYVKSLYDFNLSKLQFEYSSDLGVVGISSSVSSTSPTSGTSMSSTGSY